jgi:hypothetical protein
MVLSRYDRLVTSANVKLLTRIPLVLQICSPAVLISSQSTLSSTSTSPRTLRPTCTGLGAPVASATWVWP